MPKLKLFTKINQAPLWAKIATVSVFIAVIAAIVIVGVITQQPQDNSNPTTDQTTSTTTPTAPASNTEELTTTLDKVEADIEDDTIKLKGNVAVNTGEKVAIWLYSEPKFLGFFEIKERDGIKYISGLNEAIKKLGVETGNHNIAIITEKGKPIGYVDVYIEGNGIKSNAKPNEDESKDEDKPNDGNSGSGNNNNSGNNTPTTPKADYNLNNNLYISVIVYGDVCSIDPDQITGDWDTYCIRVVSPSNPVIAVASSASQAGSQAISKFKSSYATSTHPYAYDGAGFGPVQLSEDVCSEYGLSCGRW
jgi:hypothetical protein